MTDKHKTTLPAHAHGAKLNARPLHIVSPAYMATACFFVVAVIALVVGSFMVRVPVIVDGQGMLMADTEVVSYAIMPESDGRLEEFLVKTGSAVKKGQLIARVSIPRLENEIEAGKLALRDLRHKESLLGVFHKESLDAAQGTIRQQRVEAQSRDLSLRERLARLDKAREGDAELIKRGFLSARGSDAVTTERGQVDDQIFVSKRQMLEAETNFSELAQRQRREKLELSLNIGTQERQLQALSDRRKVEGVITSPYDGVISDLFVDLHQPITRERRVATVTPSSSVSTGKNLVTSAQVVMASGKPNQTIYILLEGKCRVETAEGRRLDVLSSGDIIGEVSFVDRRKTTVQVTADTPVVLAQLDGEVLGIKLAGDPQFAARFYRGVASVLALRLRRNLQTAISKDSDVLSNAYEFVGEIDAVDIDATAKAGARLSYLLNRLL